MNPRYPRDVAPDAKTAARARKPVGDGRGVGKRPRLLRLTPKVRAEVIEMLEQGVPMTSACVAAGIAQRTFFDWIAKGRGPDAVEPYLSFAREVDEAQERWVARSVKRVDAAGEKDYRATAWLLERRRPQEFGDPRRGDVTVNVGVIVESPEWLALKDRLLEVLAPFPDALAAVALELAGGQAETALVVEGEATELPELTP